MLRKIYSRMPGFIKGIWRGSKQEQYLSYADLNYGFMNELAPLMRNSDNQESYSQYGQDYFIWHMIFHCRKDGFFLDIGGNDPIIINNTYLFEREGWQGLAFEPQSKLAELWKDKRKTECMNVALGDSEKKIYFQERGTLSRVVHNKSEATTEVRQRTVKSILTERNIKKVDFVSIDVEGYEISVLKGMDFRSVDVILIEIEDARMKEARVVREYLRKSGYVMLARLTQDDIWIRKECLKNEQEWLKFG